VIGAFIFGAAIFLRLDQYFSGRSLWLDESLLALNIIDRPSSGLSDPLDLSQGAPLGFLIAAKLSVLSLGESELALRLVPLLCGLGALGLFYVIARRVSSGFGVLLGLVLFACSSSLVYYSVEFKQYSTEVAAGLALSAVAIPTALLTARRYLVVSLLGAILLWFAYATVFFLAAFATVYGLAFLAVRRWKDLGTVAGGSLIWLASGLAVYKVSYDDLESISGSVASGNSASSPLKPLGEAGASIINGAASVVGGTAPQELIRVAAFALGVTGAILLLRTKRYACLMLGLPIAFMFGAVLIGRYPAFERTVLIGVPAAILFIAHGTIYVARRFRDSVGAAVGVALVILLVSYPLKTAVEGIGAPQRNNQGMKPLLQELVRGWQPSDTLYVHYAAQYAFRYYAECACSGAEGDSQSPPFSFADRRTIGPDLWHGALLSRPPQLVIGTRHTPGDWAAYLSEVDPLRGRQRVWILSSHYEPEEEEYITSLLPRHLDRLGHRQKLFIEGTARLLLYDLSGPG